MSSPQNCAVAKPRSPNFFRVRPLLRRGIMYRRIVPGLVCGPQGDRGGHAGAGSRVRHRRHQLAQTAPSNSRLGASRRTILGAARNPRSVAAMGRWPGIAVRPCGPKEAGRPRQSAGGRREPAQERRVGQFQPMSQGRALACAAAASGRGPPAAGRGTSTAQGEPAHGFHGWRDAARTREGDHGDRGASGQGRPPQWARVRRRRALSA